MQTRCGDGCIADAEDSGRTQLVHGQHSPVAIELPVVGADRQAPEAGGLRIDKTIASIPQIQERVAKPHSRDSNNNNDIKEYIGGALYLATAGAAANLSELSVRRVLFDEIDRAKDNVGGEGDPGELAEARQTYIRTEPQSLLPQLADH